MTELLVKTSVVSCHLSVHSVDVTQPHDCMVFVKGLP